MSIYVPDYYADFHCIADRCRHTCCEGWEIDVDAETLGKYRTMESAFGRRLMQCIDETDTPHFRLLPGERCPMLNERNLCEVILHCGDDALCQICADHPRFRNFWTGREEIGLGLACEEAARIILTRDRPMKLVRLSGDGTEQLPEDEQELFELRQRLWDAVDETGPKARLMEYLIYRHLADALYDGLLEERLRFIEDAWLEITEKWQDGKTETLIELARRFSNAVEYDSDEMDSRLKAE